MYTAVESPDNITQSRGGAPNFFVPHFSAPAHPNDYSVLQNFRKTLAIVCPSMFVIGGAIELFMIKTGFCTFAYLICDVGPGKVQSSNIHTRICVNPPIDNA